MEGFSGTLKTYVVHGESKMVFELNIRPAASLRSVSHYWTGGDSVQMTLTVDGTSQASDCLIKLWVRCSVLREPFFLQGNCSAFPFLCFCLTTEAFRKQA